MTIEKCIKCGEILITPVEIYSKKCNECVYEELMGYKYGDRPITEEVVDTKPHNLLDKW